jgi:hypothetical protein
MNNFVCLTKNWIKKQYFNGTHYIEVFANQIEKFNDGDIYMFGIKFNQKNIK